MKLNRTRLWVAAIAVLAAGAGAFCVGPARAEIEAVMSCSKSTPCLQWDNTSTGNAIKGVSTNGDALLGETKFKSAGKTEGKAGVLGEDLSTSGTLDAGVMGTSTNGAGVSGISTSYNAVQGLSTNSTGVYGQTSAPNGFGAAGRNVGTTAGSGAGVYGDGGNFNVGVFGLSSSGNAVYAYSETGTSLHLFQGSSDTADELYIQGNGPPHDLIHVTDSTGRTAFSINGYGDLVAASSNVGALIENVAGDYQNSALFVVGGGVGTGNSVFNVFDNNGDAAMGVTDTGNVSITGLLITGGSCHSGCLVGKNRTHSVAEYASVESEPTIEDFGEGVLAGGRADVSLDAQFANVIDPNVSYSVWVTPEGDCRGLFVANRTSHGFSVRELQGGSANVPFEYRIVAKRYGVSAARLPMMALAHINPALRRGRR